MVLSKILYKKTLNNIIHYFAINNFDNDNLNLIDSIPDLNQKINIVNYDTEDIIINNINENNEIPKIDNETKLKIEYDRSLVLNCYIVKLVKNKKNNKYSKLMLYDDIKNIVENWFELDEKFFDLHLNKIINRSIIMISNNELSYIV